MEKFKYLGVWFASNGETDAEIASRVGRLGHLGRSIRTG